jgi:acyl-CoA thioesterase I
MQLLSSMTTLISRLAIIFLALYMVAAPAISKSAESTPSKLTTQPVRILVLGDSLSAEYGLKRGSGWVALLENRLAESVNWNEKPKKSTKAPKNTTNNIAPQAINTPAKSENLPENVSKIAPDFTVINASISGDTTSGGRSRLAPLIDLHHPTHVIIELGANDALRGLPVAKTEENLTTMVQTALKSKAKVLLVGIQIPPNYGSAFAKQFTETYPKVAKANKVGLVPFMLAGVADVANPADAAKLFQADRIHPTEAAHPIILNNIWPELQKQLKPTTSSKAKK